MANLKLIRVTGSPFSRSFFGCIGIQTDNQNFKIIKGGELHDQKSYNGDGWRYATLKEITADWCPIYRYWTPEKGDNVIITQDYGDWKGCKAAILEKDDTGTDYYRVQRKDGSMSTFDYTSQMILAPYSESKVETTIEPEETATTKFKIGDRVKCIGIAFKCYGKLGTIRQIGGSVGVEFDENVDGHTLDGCCEDGHGWWVGSPGLELVTETKEETVSIRFLTEQEFKYQDLWAYTNPRGWNSDGLMNKYLGQSLVIPTSSIRSDGSFVYENWTFSMNDYIVTEGVSSSKSISTPVIATKPEIPPRRFKVGDKVTYKSKGDSYHYGGDDQEGFVGTVEHDGEYEKDQGCYSLRVSTKDGDFCYNMLECEFKEYDSDYLTYSSSITDKDKSNVVIDIIPSFTLQDVADGIVGTVDTFSGYVDPLSLYKQKPITIKQKPKTKLTII